MLDIILKIISFQLLFLLVYEVLLKRETFFNYNRWYLLITPLLAVILPFLNIAALNEIVPEESVAAINSFWLPEVVIGSSAPAIENLPQVNLSTNSISVNWWIIAYGFGAILSLGIVFRKFLNLKKLFNFRMITNATTYRIIEVPSSNLACTFYKTIFLGDQLLDAEKQQILAHELVHVKGKHSLDLVFFEIFKIVFWFNPLIYIYQNRIATLHEYIADANVVETTEKGSYYEQLLNSAFNTQNISFINQFFNHSLIKKRIVMLQKSKSRTIAKTKYLLILPLLVVMLTYVSCTTQENSQPIESEGTITTQIDNLIEQIEAKGKVTKEEKIKIELLMYLALESSENNSNVTKNYNQGVDVPFGVIEQVPLYPGCENLGSNEEQKKCMTSKISNFVTSNFDTSIGKALKLTGVNRVIVQFKIDNTGEIVDVKSRAPHPKLEEEAKRVINSLPQMTPGEQNGKAVAVMYSLPIVFEVKE